MALVYPPCLNPNCKNGGKSHPNCKCWNNYTESQMAGMGYNESGSTKKKEMYLGAYASGGEVHFCSKMLPHDESCEHFADGGEVEENNEFFSNPDLSLDHAVMSHGLSHLLTKTGHTKSDDKSRPMSDHMDHAKTGRKILENRSKKVFDNSDRVESNDDHVASLSAHLDDLRENPHKLLELGGGLGGVLPDHAGALGAKAASAVDRFGMLKPQSQQLNPMNDPIPASKMMQESYKRQLSIAQNPSLVYQEIKDGTLQPDDLQTVQAIYPKLYEKMRAQTTSALVDSKTKGQDISYKHKLALGRLLNQPLDYTQSQEAMQAIIASASDQQPTQQTQQSKGPTAQTQKTIDKADRMYETPLEQRQIDRKG